MATIIVHAVANTLFVIPGSAPCAAVRTALDLKGVPYRRVDLVPVVHRLVALAAYGRRTVPGMWLAGERIGGSSAIMARLDEIAPQPRMYPADAEGAHAVQAAEAWGDQVLQPLARRLAWAVFRRRPRAMESYSAGARLGVPVWLARPTLPLVARLAGRANGVSDDGTREDLRALPGHLGRIEAWIADGTLGGATPNAADLQIGSSLQLLSTMGDLAPLLAGRPAAALTRVVLGAIGSVPAGVLPAAWLPAR
jgi:glutathione S-transferase